LKSTRLNIQYFGKMNRIDSSSLLVYIDWVKKWLNRMRMKVRKLVRKWIIEVRRMEKRVVSLRVVLC